MKLSEKILLLRKKAGLSQEDLANELDISRQAVYKWETDASSPDLDKLKQIAKLFNVSFDYLMNDEIEIEDKQTTTKGYVYTPREVYDSGVKIRRDHADIDNGYAPERKSDNYNSESFFNSIKNKAVDAMKAAGATEITFIHPHATIAFFYDAEKKVCGFYHTGKIQVVCPIENILSFTFSGGETSFINTKTRTIGVGVGAIKSIGIGSMPTMTAVDSTDACASFCYTDENSMVKTVELNFNVSSRYIVRDIKSIEDYNALTHCVMDSLLKNLKELSVKIDGLKQVGERIIDGSLQVEPLDMSAYIAVNEKSYSAYNAYLAEIEADKVKSDRERLCKNLVLIGLGVAVLVWIIVKIGSCT
ncbi:MAG: helix-turn-helix transcriptional regulator [Clostridia bacterium]|nr:helix-turn-helix transcriptional regulator [Clostridia bacterium]